MVVGFGGEEKQAPVLLLPISQLLAHEETIPEKARELAGSILSEGFFGPPVLVERSTLVILDGHHRTAALRLLSCLLVPAILADYSEIPVKKFSNPGEDFQKSLVISRALSGKKFPPKTTKHIYRTPSPVRFSLSYLRKENSERRKRGRS